MNLKKSGVSTKNRPGYVQVWLTAMTDCGGFDFFLFANYNNSRVPEANNVEISKGLKTVSIKFYSFGRIYDEGKHLNIHSPIYECERFRSTFDSGEHVVLTFIIQKTASIPEKLTLEKYTISLKDVQPLRWKQILALPFSHPRVSQTSDLFVKATQGSEQVFDRRQNHACCTYATSKLVISKKKSLLSDMENDWPFVSFFWGWGASLLLN